MAKGARPRAWKEAARRAAWKERAALVAADERYLMPGQSDLRFNWVTCRIGLLDVEEMEERVTEAWGMCVPAFLVRERLGR